MALILPATALIPKYGSIVRFAPAGRTIESTTISATAKPPGINFTDWETLGCIETGSIALENETSTEVHCFNATTGEWEQRTTPNTDAVTRLIVTLTLQEVSNFILQMAYAAATINGTTGAYVPGSQPGGVFQGWLKVQTQRKTEAVSVLDLWVELGLADAATIANRTEGWKPQVTARQLKAALDAGAFGNVTE